MTSSFDSASASMMLPVIFGLEGSWIGSERVAPRWEIVYEIRMLEWLLGSCGIEREEAQNDWASETEAREKNENILMHRRLESKQEILNDFS